MPRGPRTSASGTRIGGGPSDSGVLGLPTPYPGFAIGAFTSSNKVLSAANQLQTFQPGYTLWLAFKSTAHATTTEAVLGCSKGHPAGAGLGWVLARAGDDNGASSGKFALFAGASFALLTPNPPLNGITVVAFVWRLSDHNVLTSADGSALTSVGAVTAPVALDATCKSMIGTDNGTGLGALPLGSGRILGYAIWSREANATEAQNNTFTTGNRLLLPAAVRGDAACTVDFAAGRDWNGSAATITTLGSAPVTYAVSGTPSRLAVDELRYLARSILYFDTKRVEPMVGYVRRDAFARLRAKTSALSAVVEMTSNLFAGFPNQASIGSFTGGIWTSEKLASLNAGNEIFTAQVGAGTAKLVDFVEGVQNLSVGVFDGTFINAIRLPLYLDDGVTLANSSMIYPTAVQHRLVLLGDSILSGFLATVISQHAQTALLRGDYPTSGTGGVTAFCCGSTSMFTYASDAATLAATVALIAAELDGTVSNDLWVQLETNDYGLSLWTPAAYQAAKIAFANAVHVASPGTRIWFQTAIQRIAPATEAANGLGFTCGAYRTATGNVVAACPTFCTLVDGAAGAIVSNGNMNADGIHMTIAGCAEYKASIKTTLAY